jgi:hypothetical protein
MTRRLRNRISVALATLTVSSATLLLVGEAFAGNGLR